MNFLKNRDLYDLNEGFMKSIATTLSSNDEVVKSDIHGRNLSALTTQPAKAFVAIPSLILAACGGGGGGVTSTTDPTIGSMPEPVQPPAALVPLTSIQAARFLSQSAMGSSSSDIAHVQTLGIKAWLTEQFATPRATTHWDWLVAGGYNAPANIFTENGYDASIWQQLIAGKDQLRQRVGMALLDVLVASISTGLPGAWRPFNMAAYIDILMNNAFGNYRNILDKVSTNAAMGSYLTFLNNRKADKKTGAVPDENYAREVMQLFTIGLYELNMDGTQKKSNGAAVETYTQADVIGLASVFTGWILASTDTSTPDNLRLPLIQSAGQHELASKTFLGKTINANTDGVASLRAALDQLFGHDNTPPFISKQLIQRLVTSNPSPGFVGRVAAIFANNGSGVRGDMQAIVRAILTDDEARSDSNLQNPSFGKLREPYLRLTNWARAFDVTSPSGAWLIGDTSSVANRLGQSPGRAPNVFNFFRPGYTPPNSALSAQGLLAPEFQITNEPTVTSYVNYMMTLISAGTGDVKANYAEMLPLAGDSQKLVDLVNLLLAAGQVKAQTVGVIKGAIDSISMTSTTGAANRVYTAITMVMASPEYIVQK